MLYRVIQVVAGLLVAFSPLQRIPSLAEEVPIAIVQDRLYRQGVFLVVDALVENQSAPTIAGVEVSVEFYDFFDELLRVEPTLVTPNTLGPGHRAAFRVVTPYTDTARRVVYRFTWRQNGEQRQAATRRDIWAIGRATREQGARP